MKNKNTNLKLPEIKYNTGFENRIFLTETEWDTFRKRKPVRYIKGRPHDRNCSVCGEPARLDNPLQHAHRIGFEMGIIYFGLTPDFVDSPKNIVSAHKRSCNSAAELTLGDTIQFLIQLGIKSLPEYLPQEIKEHWLLATVSS